MVDATIFISHSKSDEKVAGKMCEILEQQGLRCRYSGRDIPLGARWDKWITREIRICKAVIVIVSGEANKSDYVQGEVHFAHSNGKPLIPFQIDNVQLDGNLALHLERLQRITALEDDKTDKLKALANGLAETLEKGAATRKPRNTSGPPATTSGGTSTRKSNGKP